ncbi:HintN domain-containing protein [Meloidogyne graminicola]|uniref:HintN domain-containing protein n=1 Tax=Meloidogyne graminicola TaxID=189291 RepID=A0A8S9ZG85_9BILA|nr:HintN domain-containing protein [Meloidogyne graminicola]
MWLLILIIKITGIFIFNNLIKNIFCSFCGESAIPFSLEILPSGHPILGCAQPNCFGWNAFGKPYLNNSNFYRVNKQPDGFFRKSFSTTIPKPLNDIDSNWYKPQIAPLEIIIVKKIIGLLLRCCYWNGLINSENRGIANLSLGNIVYGGEVFNDEYLFNNKRQYAFDYIKNIIKINKNKYQVFIYRMPCLPRPEKLSLLIEPGTNKLATGPLKNEKLFSEQINELKNKKIILDNEIIKGPFKEENNEQQNNEINEENIKLKNNNNNKINLKQQKQRKKIICDRNMTRHYSTRFSRQCAEIEVPENTQVEINQEGIEENYGGENYGNPNGGYYYYVQPSSTSYFQCFSSDNNIRLSNGKLNKINKLNINDWIYSINNSHIVLSKVERWIHKVPNQLTNFIKIKLFNGKILKITEKHFIYVYKGNDCFNNKIINIKTINSISSIIFAKNVKIGIYSPLTTSGNLFVEGILTSCFSIESNSILQKSIFSNYLSIFSNLLNKLLFNEYNNLDMIEELPKWLYFVVNNLLPIGRIYI